MNPGDGGTLFQLNEEIKNVNNFGLDAQDDDDEEERREQIRRNDEIAKNLDRYLLDDDDPTENQLIDSLCNDDDDDGDVSQKCEATIEKLQFELAAKSSEIERLRVQLQREVADKERAINEYQKRVDIALAERDRATLTRNQTHELLIESKSQITEMESREKEIKQLLDSAHEANKSLRVELQQAKTMYSDLQYKMHILETDVDKRHQLSANNSLKEIREKYNAQINLLQQQVDCLTGKLENKEDTLKSVKDQLHDLERSNDMLRVLQNGGSLQHFLDKLKSFEKELLNASEISQCSRIHQNFTELLTESLNLTKTPDHSPRFSHSALSPFPYITPGKGFNSTENPKHVTRDGSHTPMFQNGFTVGDDLISEYQAKYRALEQELSAKASEIEELQMQLDKTQALLNNANKNFECLKGSYVALSCEKDTAVRDLEVLKNSDIYRKLKIQQDKVFCLERDLELTNEKLKFQCGMKKQNTQDRAISPIPNLLDSFIKDTVLSKADSTMKRYEFEVDETVKKFKDSESNYIRAIDTLKNQLTDLERRLKIRCQEVESLKAAILFERNETKVQLEQNESELKKLKADNQALKEQEVKLLKDLQRVRSEAEKKVQLLTEKLLRCHKVTDAYKKYIHEKEMHYIKETDRIRAKYQANLGKIRERFEELMKNSRKKLKRIKEVEKQHEKTN